jgi:hypothetical protein
MPFVVMNTLPTRWRAERKGIVFAVGGWTMISATAHSDSEHE